MDEVLLKIIKDLPESDKKEVIKALQEPTKKATEAEDKNIIKSIVERL